MLTITKGCCSNLKFLLVFWAILGNIIPKLLEYSLLLSSLLKFLR
jgi:hypothetical protein